MSIQGMMMNRSKFSKIVEDLVRTKRLSYIDAILYFCEKNNVDEEDVKKYISGPIKNKIEVEAMNLNFLPRGNKLPLE